MTQPCHFSCLNFSFIFNSLMEILMSSTQSLLKSCLKLQFIYCYMFFCIWACCHYNNAVVGFRSFISISHLSGVKDANFLLIIYLISSIEKKYIIELIPLFYMIWCASPKLFPVTWSLYFLLHYFVGSEMTCIECLCTMIFRTEYPTLKCMIFSLF